MNQFDNKRFKSKEESYLLKFINTLVVKFEIWQLVQQTNKI